MTLRSHSAHSCLLALALAGALLLALPALARAVDPVVALKDAGNGAKTLEFSTPSGGRSNDVVVKLVAAKTTYEVTDTGTAAARVDAGAGCSSAGQNKVTCPAADVGSLALYLGTSVDSSLIGCQEVVRVPAVPRAWDCPPGESAITIPAIVDGGVGNDDGGMSVTERKRDNIDACLPNVNDDALARLGLGLFGGQGDDLIVGADGRDVLNGGLGSDKLRGGEDVDMFCGGPSSFSSYGGSIPLSPPFDDGTDFVDYSDHEDPVIAGLDGGVDGDRRERDGGERVTRITPDDAVEGMIGGHGDDLLTGTDFNDFLIGGPGADDMRGALGTDTVDYSDETDPLNVTIGDGDALSFSAARLDGNDGSQGEHDNVESDVEDVIGGHGDDALVGSDLSVVRRGDLFFVRPGANALYGMGGNDTLDGRAEADVLSGGDGFDRVQYGPTDAGLRTQGVEASIGNGPLSGAPGEGDSIFDDVEAVTGTPLDDTLTGSPNGDAIDGLAGNDTIDGGDGADTVNGGDGSDALDGQGGFDQLNGGANDDMISGGDGNDSVAGGAGDDTMAGGAGADTFAGNAGRDGVDYSIRLAPVSATADGAPNDGGGGEGDNILADVESLTGGKSNDLLVGGPGDGTIDGGAGNDSVDGGGGADALIGGAGNDEASYSARTNAVGVTIGAGGNDDGEPGEGDNVGADIERATGGSGPDTIVGDGAANVLSGLGGNDTIEGGGGQDALNGGTEDDTLGGGEGDDTLGGDQGNDRLDGGAGNDFLRGATGDDVLDGSGGADTLDGGDGSDTADFAGRIGDLTLSIDGAPNDGEPNENDNIKTDVETIASGRGNDLINSVDGNQSHVSCGLGKDSLTSDRQDTSDGCESVSVTTLGARPLQISTSKLKLSKRGVIRIRVSCPADAKLDCRGNLAVTSSASALRKKKLGTIGRASVQLSAGKSKLVAVRLSRSGRKAVKHAGRKGMVVSVAITGGAFDSNARVRLIGSSKRRGG